MEGRARDSEGAGAGALSFDLLEGREPSTLTSF